MSEERTIAELAQFEVAIELISHAPAKNRHRFYKLTWQPCLFGGWALVRTWGRVGTEGQSLPIFFEEREVGRRAVEKILKLRFAHGYAAIRWQ